MIRSASCELSARLLHFIPELAHQSVDNVLGIRVVTRIDALTPNEVHDLVLALSGDGSIGNDDLYLCCELA